MSQVVVRGPFAFAQTLGGGQVDDPESALPLEDRCSRQAQWALETLAEAMGASDEDGSGAIARLRVHFARKQLFPYFEANRMAHAGHREATPPSSALGTGRHQRRRWSAYDLLGLEAIGLSAGGRAAGWDVTQMEVKEAQVSAHYGQGRYMGPLLFLAGVLGNVPDEHRTLMGFEDEPEAAERFATGRSHTDYRRGRMMAQAWHCWRQVAGMLAAEQMTLDDVAHVSVFVDDPTQLPYYKEVEREFLTAPVARTVIVVEEVGHRDCLLEVEVTAYPRSSQRPLDGGAPEDGPALMHGDVAGVVAGPLLLGSGFSAVPSAAGGVEVIGPAAQLRGIHPPGFVACCTALARLEALLDAAGWPMSSAGQVRLHLTADVDPHQALAALGTRGWLKDPPLVSLVPSHDDVLGMPGSVTAELVAVDPAHIG